MFPMEADYHVHCGQFYDTYYQPSDIIKAIHNNGIKELWISSTTSCISWQNEEEKAYILQHIDDELREAIVEAQSYKIKITPLYWVLPQRKKEGESIEKIMDNSLYKGFKIHPKIGDWSLNDPLIEALMNEVCMYASKHGLPILIHTGVDEIDSPAKFEHFFEKCNTVTFVLAHCKNVEAVIEMFSKHKNVYGDISFCPQMCYNRIYNMGFADRLLIGTDFPITHWCSNEIKASVIPKSELISNYKKVIKKIETLINI